MTSRNKPFVRKNGLPGLILNCDNCRARISAVDGYFNCGNAVCDWDLCLPCGGGVKPKE